MKDAARDDVLREYIEARMHQEFGRRSFLKLSSGLVVGTVATGAIGTFLAACASSPSSAPSAVGASSAASAAASSFAGTTLDFIGLDGEDGNKSDLAKAWLKTNGITLNSKFIGAGDEIRQAILAGQPYDLSITFNTFVHEYAAGEVIKKIDTTRLSNWADLFPGIAKANWLNIDGEPWIAPIAWGDGPFIYNPAKVPEKLDIISWASLWDPKWKKRITTVSDPGTVFHQTALMMGFSKSPFLTKDQLAQVADKSTEFVKNQIVGFAATYADCTDMLIRGEADLSLYGWEQMLLDAKTKGTELAVCFLETGRGGWCDGLSIPTTVVDEAAAYAYIDLMISPEVNAQLAAGLASAATNQKAPALMPADGIPYDYKLVAEPNDAQWGVTAPATVDDPATMATNKDWQDAWAKIIA